MGYEQWSVVLLMVSRLQEYEVADRRLTQVGLAQTFEKIDVTWIVADLDCCKCAASEEHTHLAGMVAVGIAAACSSGIDQESLADTASVDCSTFVY